MTIEAAVSASSRFADTLPTVMGPSEVTKLLNSRVERDILSGMKCVMALISRGEDGLPFFGDVVKNITTGNNQVKRLILIYLTRYAEFEPDTALLSINTIQKSLNDKDPVSRSAAIRAMAGIQISSIAPIVLLCIKKCVTDSSPLVRGAAAIAVGKVYETEDLDRASQKQLLAHLVKLLGDGVPAVVGSALKTYHKIKPDISSTHQKWDMIHHIFRKLCRILPRLDEWSQTFTVEILSEYCRLFLPRPKLYLEDGSVVDFGTENAGAATIGNIPYDISYDADLELFLESLKGLVHTQSEHLLLGVSKAIFNLAPPLVYIDYGLSQSMVRLVSPSTPFQVSYFVLQAVRSISILDPSVFTPFYKRFYIFPTDLSGLAQLKLEILSLLTNEDNFKNVFDELKYYAINSRGKEDTVGKEALTCMGRCAQISSQWSHKVLNWCLKQVKRTTLHGESIVGELLTVIRHLLQQKQDLLSKSSDGNEEVRQEILKTTYRLSLALLDTESKLDSNAKASIIWIIGEFTGAANNLIGPDVLRRLIKTYALEADNVRYEILVLAAKILSFELEKLNSEKSEIDMFFQENIIAKMFAHVLHLAKYDRRYDTRDRARMLSVLLAGENHESQLAALFLQVPKGAPIVKLDSRSNKDTTIASRDFLFAAFSNISDWTDPSTHPPSSVRTDISEETAGGNGVVTAISSQSIRSKSGSPPISNHSISSQQFHLGARTAVPRQTYKLQSLDEFFGDDDEEELQEDSDEEEDEEEEEDDVDDENLEEGVSSTEEESELESSEEESSEEEEEEESSALFQNR